MRTKLIAGVLTTAALAASASPALAQSDLTPQQQAVANAPQIHVDACSAKQTKHGYVSVVCPLYAINMGTQTVGLHYSSNMRTFEPKGYTSYVGSQTGTFGVPGNGRVYSRFTLKLAIKGKTLSQVERGFKLTISDPTNGGVIVNSVATVQG